MTTIHCLPHQALVDSICAAVDHGDATRVAQLLDLLELVADADLLDRVETALRGPVVPSRQRPASPPTSCPQHTSEGGPKRT